MGVLEREASGSALPESVEALSRRWVDAVARLYCCEVGYPAVVGVHQGRFGAVAVADKLDEPLARIDLLA